MEYIIVVDHYPLSPRVQKMRDSILSLKIADEVVIIAWNRNNSSVKEEYVRTFNQRIGYGNFWKSVFNFKKFLKYAKDTIEFEKPEFVHLVDYSVLNLAKKLNSSINIVYEVYDIKFYKNKFINQYREYTEKKIVKNVNSLILASPFFEEYYKKKMLFNNTIIVINNKPTKNSVYQPLSMEIVDKISNFKGERLCISFIGTVRYKEIMRNLIDSISFNDNCCLLIAGDGPDCDYLKNYTKHREDILFLGRFTTNELSSIYDASDVIWAAYPNKDKNVKYAISNKFFESLALKRKVIVSEKTYLSDLVRKDDLGYSVNPYDVKSISDMIDFASKENLSLLVSKKNFWEDEEHQLLKII